MPVEAGWYNQPVARPYDGDVTRNQRSSGHLQAQQRIAPKELSAAKDGRPRGAAELFGSDGRSPGTIRPCRGYQPTPSPAGLRSPRSLLHASGHLRGTFSIR